MVLIYCGIVGVIWVVITIRLIIALRRTERLEPVEVKDESTVKLSVIVPARDEEKDIAACLQSILNQNKVNLEVIVVNDHSIDRTAEIIDKMAEKDHRVKVIHNPELREGWLGKCNAMQHGAAKATGEYLVFSDADIMHEPFCFRTALMELEEKGYDCISLLPRFKVKPFWENVILPMYFFGIAKLYSEPGLQDPESTHAVAAGAFILVKAKVFKEVGGFEKIKGEMGDDVAFARLIKKKRYGTGFRFAPLLLNVEMFKNNRDAFWGTTKNVLLAVEEQVWLAIPMMLMTIFLFWAPLYAVLAGALTRDILAVSAGIAIYAFQYLSMFLIRSIGYFHPVKLLFFPLVVIVVLCCASRALYYYKIRGTVVWRGRKIQVKS